MTYTEKDREAFEDYAVDLGLDIRRAALVLSDYSDEKCEYAWVGYKAGLVRGWKPSFDAMSPDQEQLAQQFCAEIAGPRGAKSALPDPIRLLEMAEALYTAELKDQLQREVNHE